MATRAAVEELKAQWNSDPCWDIEDTEGFEDHYDELLSYRTQSESEWELERVAKLREFAWSIGLPDNLELAAHILKMEAKMECMQHRIDELQNKTASL